MEMPGPIRVDEVFRETHEALIELLRNLPPERWNLPTGKGVWTVKDVVAHILDGTLRRLSFQRDRAVPPDPAHPIVEYSDLVAFLDGLNAEWVAASRRLSPRVLTDILEVSANALCDYLETLDPAGPGHFAVAWAGERESAHWFDIARDYTEIWHHQQQIRDAVSLPGLTQRRYLYPVLDTFMRALPHAYRSVERPTGHSVTFRLQGDAGGDWTLLREESAWTLRIGAAPVPDTLVLWDTDAAWRRLTKGLDRASAFDRLRVEGDSALGETILDLVAIVG